jgi:cysteine desulfurase / selenocysteine lyase
VIRHLFPACERYAYLNTAGVAPTSTLVRDAVARWTDDLLHHGDAHEEAWEAEVDRIRTRAATLAGGRPEEIAFVRNTSHGLGLVAEGLDWRAGDEVAVCTSIEYPSNVYVWEHLVSRGVSVREIEARGGGVTPEAVEHAIGPRTRVVATSAVQYATGHRTDLAALGEICRRRGVLLVVDAIQQLGAFPLDARALGIHALAADGHKWLMGTSGAGILWVDGALLPRLRPVLVGWKSTTGAWDFDRARFELRPDADKLEEGSPAYALVWGLGAAIDLLLDTGVPRIAAHIQELCGYAETRLRAIGCDVGPAPAERAGILTVRTPGDPKSAQERCTAAGVMVSVRRGRLRVSPGAYGAADDIDRLIAALTR